MMLHVAVDRHSEALRGARNAGFSLPALRGGTRRMPLRMSSEYQYVVKYRISRAI